MASYPGRNHTKRGERIARNGPFCQHTQPDPCCDCDACNAYFDRLDRRTDSPSREIRGLE